MERLRKHAPILNAMHKGSPGMRRSLIDQGPPELVTTIGDCCRNVLNGNVPITANHKRKLRRYRQALHLLSQKRVSVKRKKKILQRGGFIGTLLSAIAAPLLGLILGQR